MASGTRLNNTFEESLNKIYKSISEAKLTDDADIAWLIELETMIIEKIRQPFEEQSQMAGGMDPMMGGGGMGGMPDPSFPPMPGGGDLPRGMGMGGMVNPISSDPSELQRFMS